MPTAWPGRVVVRAVDVEKVGGKNLKTCFKIKKTLKRGKNVYNTMKFSKMSVICKCKIT